MASACAVSPGNRTEAFRTQTMQDPLCETRIHWEAVPKLKLPGSRKFVLISRNAAVGSAWRRTDFGAQGNLRPNGVATQCGRAWQGIGALACAMLGRSYRFSIDNAPLGGIHMHSRA
eukprot:303980-Chlamydomonas_euryale.AAC.15